MKLIFFFNSNLFPSGILGPYAGNLCSTEIFSCIKKDQKGIFN